MKTEHKLSKFYIQEKGQLKCFEDCSLETQKEFLETNYDKSLVILLADKLYALAELFGIYGNID